MSYSVMGASICPRAWILTEAYDNHYGLGGNSHHLQYGRGALSRLLPVGSRFSALVRRAARRRGMGRDHLLTKPEHGPIRIRGHAPSMELSLAPSTMSGGLAQRKKKTRHLRRTFFASIFLFSPICNSCFPLVYKREGRVPH